LTGFSPFGVSSVEDEMNCKKTQKKLSKSFDRGIKLDPALKNHLQQCPECKRFWDDLATLDSAVHDLQTIQAPGDLTPRVMAAISRAKVSRPFILRPVWAGAMAVILALVVGFWVGNRLEASSTIDSQTTVMADAFSENFTGSLWSVDTLENNSN
jgi:predicted anti-sigma-YlaC factor YlaD